ncbi:unnamed protein product, partial [Tilletia controversa]
LASAGGDGRINVFELTEPEQAWDPTKPVSSPTTLSPTHTLLTTLPSAHGVSDINSLAFAPTSYPSAISTQSRFQEIDDDADRAKGAMDRITQYSLFRVTGDITAGYLTMDDVMHAIGGIRW